MRTKLFIQPKMLSAIEQINIKIGKETMWFYKVTHL